MIGGAQLTLACAVIVTAMIVHMVMMIRHVARAVGRMEDRFRIQEQHYTTQENYLVERIAELKTENENLRHRVSQRL